MSPTFHGIIMSRKIAFILMITALFISTMANGDQFWQASVKSDAPDTWRQTNQGQTEFFWADFDNNGVPEIYFAMLGYRYRNLQIDADQNGIADLVTLLNQNNQYQYFIDPEQDGVFKQIDLGSFTGEQISIVKTRLIILKGVQRRIFMDRHGDKWEPSNGAILQNGFFDSNNKRGERISIRLTHTPSIQIEDPGFEIKPIALPDKSFTLYPGVETSWSPGTLYLSDDLLGEGRSPKAVSLTLSAFFLKVEPPIEKTKSTTSKPVILVQVSGNISIGNIGESDFCALLDMSFGAASSATVTLIDPNGNETGALFIEAFFTK